VVANERADLDDERRAIARAQAGNLSALEPLLRTHAEALFSSVILPRIGDRMQAEDLLKDTLVTAMEKIDNFQWQGRSIFFWLRKIALRRVIDLHRAAGRARLLEEALLREADGAAELAGADEKLVAEEDRRSAQERIEAALAQLSDRYAQVIRLRLMHGVPRDECAERFGVTTATFDVLLFRAVRAFRKAYGDRE
jgi:RNA polymerase sigma factor (sigma-70 family)